MKVFNILIHLDKFSHFMIIDVEYTRMLFNTLKITTPLEEAISSSTAIAIVVTTPPHHSPLNVGLANVCACLPFIV